MKIVEFDTEAEAVALEKLAWIATVQQAVSEGETALDSVNTQTTSLVGYPVNEIAKMKICGHLGGQLITSNGATVAYSAITQAYDQDPPKWWIPAPIGLVDLTGYSVLDELPAEWIPPLDI